MIMNRLCAILCLLLIPVVPVAAEELREDELTIAAVGDIMLGGRTEPYLEQRGPDYPFRDVLPVLRLADVIAGNLGLPSRPAGGPWRTRSSPFAQARLPRRALKKAGIRVVTLANNHSMDFGPPALQDTLKILAENNILFTGAGMDLDDARSPALLKVKGTTLAFLSYSLTFPLEFFASARRPGTAPGYADFVRADIQKVRPLADLVVVSFHWGAGS